MDASHHRYRPGKAVFRLLGTGLCVMAGIVYGNTTTTPTTTDSMNASDTAVTDPNTQPPALQSFTELRAAILNQIGAATKRIWLVTDYLTDGEICAALYLAQYRNIDVQVLLGRKYAHQYMSRLKFLKDQNIPVFLKPLKFTQVAPTALLTDDKLVAIDSDLNFMGKHPQYALKPVHDPARVQTFVQEFSTAAQQKNQAVARPVPLVGRPGIRGPVYQPPAAASPQAPGTPASRTTTAVGADDVYNYDRHRQKHRQPPPGVTRRLPRETIQQQTQMQITE